MADENIVVSAQDVGIQRANLVHVCRLAVKSLIDRSCSEPVDEKCPELVNVCAVLENIMSHRLKSHQTWYGAAEPQWFWQYIRTACQRMPHHCINSVNLLESAQSAHGKGRAWLRLALMEKRLSDYLTVALQQPKLTKSFYQDGAFMLSDEAHMVTGMLQGLNAIDFSFDLKSEQLDYPLTAVIDYTPYLCFPRRDHKDDILLEKLHSMSENEDDQRPLAEDYWHERYNKLQSQYKVIAEQKGYMEELVRLRDGQLDELHTHRQRLLDTLQQYKTEGKRERHQLEGVIIELQAQLSAAKEEYHNEVMKLQTRLRRFSSQPPSIAMSDIIRSLSEDSDNPDISDANVAQPPSAAKHRQIDKPGSESSPLRRPTGTPPKGSAAGVKGLNLLLPHGTSAGSDPQPAGSDPQPTLSREDNHSMVALAGSYTSETSVRSTGDLSLLSAAAGLSSHGARTPSGQLSPKAATDPTLMPSSPTADIAADEDHAPADANATNEKAKAAEETTPEDSLSDVSPLLSGDKSPASEGALTADTSDENDTPDIPASCDIIAEQSTPHND